MKLGGALAFGQGHVVLGLDPVEGGIDFHAGAGVGALGDGGEAGGGFAFGEMEGSEVDPGFAVGAGAGDEASGLEFEAEGFFEARGGDG